MRSRSRVGRRPGTEGVGAWETGRDADSPRWCYVREDAEEPWVAEIIRDARVKLLQDEHKGLLAEQQKSRAIADALLKSGLREHARDHTRANAKRAARIRDIGIELAELAGPQARLA